MFVINTKMRERGSIALEISRLLHRLILEPQLIRRHDGVVKDALYMPDFFLATKRLCLKFLLLSRRIILSLARICTRTQRFERNNTKATLYTYMYFPVNWYRRFFMGEVSCTITQLVSTYPHWNLGALLIKWHLCACPHHCQFTGGNNNICEPFKPWKVTECYQHTSMPVFSSIPKSICLLRHIRTSHASSSSHNT